MPAELGQADPTMVDHLAEQLNGKTLLHNCEKTSGEQL